ncbi:hypothetical protein ABU614_09200 [Lysobacter firmicutimachus]|uniref:Uncharacterized protein n=1 Tax=Lysobacter firmicutimachus TaxID=1792846 RepID=A0AAU8MZ13_9GAMM
MTTIPFRLPRKAPASDLGYWAIAYHTASFHRAGVSFRDYGPALYLGVAVFNEHPEYCFDDPRLNLERRYRDVRGNSCLDWAQAKPAARAAWERAQAQALAAQIGPAENLRLCAHA